MGGIWDPPDGPRITWLPGGLRAVWFKIWVAKVSAGFGILQSWKGYLHGEYTNTVIFIRHFQYQGAYWNTKDMSISDCSINHVPSVKLPTMGHIGEALLFRKSL